MTSAFHGNAAEKQAVIAQLDAGEPHVLYNPGAAAADVIAWAGSADLPPAFVLLLGHLARGDAKEAEVFVRTLLEAIEPGADLEPIAHRWAIWVWDGAPEPLRTFMSEPYHMEAGLEAVALHARAAKGEGADRAAWRKVRGLLGRLSEEDTDAGLAAGVLAASSWDYRTVPGAAADMVTAWERMEMTRIRHRHGWSESDDAAVYQIIADQKAVAEQRLGPSAGQPKDEYRAKLSAEISSLIQQIDDPLFERHGGMRGEIGEAFSNVRTSGRAALLSLLEAPVTTPA